MARAGAREALAKHACVGATVGPAGQGTSKPGSAAPCAPATPCVRRAFPRRRPRLWPSKRRQAPGASRRRRSRHAMHQGREGPGLRQTSTSQVARLRARQRPLACDGPFRAGGRGFGRPDDDKRRAPRVGGGVGMPCIRDAKDPAYGKGTHDGATPAPRSLCPAPLTLDPLLRRRTRGRPECPRTQAIDAYQDVTQLSGIP